MADIYDLQDDAQGLAEAVRLVREEFAKAAEQQREELERKRQLERQEQALAEAEADRLDLLRQQADVMREQASAIRGVTEGISVVGSILSDVFGQRAGSVIQKLTALAGQHMHRPGEAPAAAQGVAGAASSSVKDMTVHAQNVVVREGGGSAAAPAAAKQVGGGSAGSLSGLLAGASVAGTALTALSGAAQSAYGTFIRFVGAANPAAVSVLNQTFDILAQRVGVILLPAIPKLGAMVLTLADKFKFLAEAVSKWSLTWNSAVDAGAAAIVNFTTAGTAGIAELLVQTTARLSGYLDKAAQENLRKQGLDPNNLVGSAAANFFNYGKIGGEDIGKARKKDDQQFKDYERDIAQSIIMKSSGASPQWEGVDAAYKRIQQASAGVTPTDQKQLDETRKIVQYLADLYGLAMGSRPPPEPAGGGR